HNIEPLHPGCFIDGFEKPGKYIDIQTDQQEHKATGDHKKLHDACIGAGCILFLALAKEKWFRSHPECLDHNGDQDSEPVDIPKDPELVLCFCFGQVYYVLVDQPAEHIIDHTAHADNDQWI